MEFQGREARERVVLDVTVRRSEKDTQHLYEAAMEGSVPSLTALLQKDPLILNQVSLTSFSETPLHVASSLGHLDFARALLDKKPRLALELDSFTRSPLHLASAEGHADVVKLLVDKAPDACLVADRDDRIPLHLAAIRGRVEVLRELTRGQPDSVRVTLHGDSVAHLCVKYGHLQALAELLENDRDRELLKSQDSDGNNILHLAVMLNHFKIAKYLGSVRGVEEIASGVNRDGFTPLDVFDKGQSKDFNGFRIQQILTEIGVQRGNNSPPPPAQPPPTTTTLVRRGRRQKIWQWFHDLLEQRDWITETHGNLMVVATVIATMCFQSLMNPPGGVWQQDPTSGASCSVDNVCKAGTPVLAYGEDQSVYENMIHSNAMAFMLSLCIILMHFGGFPLRTRGGALLVTIVMWWILVYLSVVYAQASILLHPQEILGFDIFTNMLIPAGIWSLLLISIVAIHTFRIVRWITFRLRFIRRLCPRAERIIQVVLYLFLIVGILYTLTFGRI